MNLKKSQYPVKSLERSRNTILTHSLVKRKGGKGGMGLYKHLAKVLKKVVGEVVSTYYHAFMESG